MNISNRREFLKAVAAGGFALSSFAVAGSARAQATPVARQRLEDFVSQPARLAALKRGVAVMKARLPSDPTSWFYQGAIHAVTPEAIQAALAIDPGVANVDQARYWNQCPHSSNQNSADFLIWHRAYLYYFERILRTAAGDASLSLPYWNYTDPTRRAFPEQFADPDTDPVTQVNRNPLFDHRREQAFTFGLYELSEGTAGTVAIFRETDFFGATEDTGFAGGVADNNARTRGRIERQPHDLIHFAIGGAIGTGEVDTGDATAGLMASVSTAAFDPIFWVHHANIDRLWTVWECLTVPPRQWGRVPPKDWLDSKPWHFNDVGGQVVNHSRSYYLDRRNLQVAYDSDQSACEPLSSAPLSSSPVGGGGPSPLAVGTEIRSFSVKAEAGARLGSGRIAPDTTYSVDVPLRQLPSSLGGTAKNSVLSAVKTAPRRVVLEIDDLNVEGITSVGFDVYVNLPEGVAPNRESSSYVGTVSLFGASQSKGHAHHGHSPAVQRFDISRVVVAESFDPARVRVQVVPFDLLTPRAGRPRIRRAVGLTHGQIRVLILEGSLNPTM